MLNANLTSFNAYKFFILSANEFEISCLEKLKQLYEDYIKSNFKLTLEENEK